MKGNSIYQRIGNRIFRERKKLGLTQEDLSGITSLHRTHIARLEKGRLNPTIRTLTQLARKFHITINDLIRGL